MKVKFLLVLALVALSAFACNLDPTTTAEFNEPIAAVVQAVDARTPNSSFDLLTTKARDSVKQEAFDQAISTGDMGNVADVFRQSLVPENNGTRQVRVEVKSFRGSKGDVIFVMLQESGDWRINRIVEP